MPPRLASLTAYIGRQHSASDWHHRLLLDDRHITFSDLEKLEPSPNRYYAA